MAAAVEAVVVVVLEAVASALSITWS